MSVPNIIQALLTAGVIALATFMWNASTAIALLQDDISDLNEKLTSDRACLHLPGTVCHAEYERRVGALESRVDSLSSESAGALPRPETPFIGD